MIHNQRMEYGKVGKREGMRFTKKITTEFRQIQKKGEIILETIKKFKRYIFTDR